MNQCCANTSAQWRYEWSCAWSALLSPYILHSKLWWWFSRVIPWGSPNENYMAVISDWNYSVCARDPDPSGNLQFFSFTTATIWGHTHNDAYWYAQKSWSINEFIPPLASAICLLLTFLHMCTCTRLFATDLQYAQHYMIRWHCNAATNTDVARRVCVVENLVIVPAYNISVNFTPSLQKG